MEPRSTPRRTYVWIATGVGIAAAIAIASVALATNPASNSTPSQEVKSISIRVFPPDSKPYGKSYGEWNQEWWEWAQSKPIQDNPISDTTGEKCPVNQNNPDVWFLAGTTGGRVERSCTIPASKAIFFPLLNTECSTAEDPSLKTEEALRECARNGSIRGILAASVNGQEIPDLKKYWAESSLYNYTLSEDNIWGVPAGSTPQVAAGYYLMIEPLAPGEHEIIFSGVNTDIAGTQTFATESVYHITVVE